MNSIEKLEQAQKLLSDIYHEYGELWGYDNPVSRAMSCADDCVIESIDWLYKNENDTYDEYGVNTKSSFNTPPREAV